MEQVPARRDDAACNWVVKRHLSDDGLKQYVARLAIARAQVVAITEPQDGTFTLIFEPTDEQVSQLDAEEGQVAETLDELFGVPVTPVQTPTGEEVGTVIVDPVPATPDPIPATPDPLPT